MSKQSLASKKSMAVAPVEVALESSPGAGLPAGLEDTGGGMMVAAPSFLRTPYVQFVSNKGSLFGKLLQRIPDLQDGDPVFIRGDDIAIKLNPFAFYLREIVQHWSVVDDMGKIVKTTFDKANTKKDTTVRWSEHIETLLMVILPDGRLSPACCTFKTLKCDCAHAAIEAFNQATDAAVWGAKGPDYKQSLSVPQVWARFITTATVKRSTFTTGRAGVVAKGFIRPAGPTEWTALAATYADETFKELCEATADRFRRRVLDLKSKAI